MNRICALALLALALAAAACGGAASAPAPAPASSVPSGYNAKTVDGSKGEPSIPVACNTANGDVSIPAGAFSGTQTVSIECISQSQKNELTSLVKQQTKSTNVALGAVRLEPSPFTFNKDVTVVIPLDPTRPDLGGKTVELYVYSPDVSGKLQRVAQAQVDSNGRTATAKVKRFSIFILVGPEEGATENPTEPPVTGYTCDDPLGCVDVTPGDSIRIAGLLDFSGQGELSTAMWNGVRDAIGNYVNIGGFAVTAYSWDAGCNTEMGASAAYAIISDPQIAGAIGTLCSSSASSARGILSDAGYVMISPGNTNASFTFTERYPGYFRIAIADVYQAQMMAEFAYRRLGARTMGIYLADHDFGFSMADGFRQRFESLGGKIAAYEVVPPGQTDYYALMYQLQSSGVEAVYMPLFAAEAGYFTAYAREFGMDFPLLGSDAINSGKFYEIAGGAVENVYFTEAVPSVSAQPYAYGYDAAWLLLEAISRVAIVDENGVLHIGRQALRDALYGISFNGQSGYIACDQRGDCGHAAIAVYLVKGGVPAEIARYTP